MYAYWSNESLEFAPEYQKAAKILLTNDPPVVLGRIDAASNDVTNRIRLTSGIPYIRLVAHNKTIYDYNGDFEANSLVQWAKRLVGDKSIKLESSQ